MHALFLVSSLAVHAHHTAPLSSLPPLLRRRRRFWHEIRNMYEGERAYVVGGRGETQYRGATLSTQPTPKGQKELDLFHRFHGLQVGGRAGVCETQVEDPSRDPC